MLSGELLSVFCSRPFGAVEMEGRITRDEVGSFRPPKLVERCRG